MKKIICSSVVVIVLIALAWAVHYAWVSFPIISGFDAKQVCSCVFVAHMNKQDIDTNEMAEFPFSLAKYKIDMNDSSVTATVWGMAKRKAIYRKNIGCTLIYDINEDKLRSQIFSIPSPPAFNTDTIPFPYGDKIADSIPSNINTDKLNAAVDKAFTEPYPGKKQRTRAVIVVYDGKLIAEKYAPGFNKDTKMYGWSMAKSFGAVLIGILVKQGKLDVKQPALFLNGSNDIIRDRLITIENLLQQMSGLDFKEDYSGASDVTAHAL